MAEPRMSQAEWEAFCDKLIATSRKAKAIIDGDVHVEHLAVHEAIVRHMDAHGCTYPEAFDAVTLEDTDHAV